MRKSIWPSAFADDPLDVVEALNLPRACLDPMIKRKRQRKNSCGPSGLRQEREGFEYPASTLYRRLRRAEANIPLIMPITSIMHTGPQ